MRIFILLFVVCCFPISQLCSQATKQVAALKVAGTQLTDVSGKTLVLRGVSFGWHNWWPRFYNGGAVQWLKNDWNCNVVRAAMGVEPDKGYIKEKDWYDLVPAASISLIVKAIPAAEHGCYFIDVPTYNTDL